MNCKCITELRSLITIVLRYLKYPQHVTRYLRDPNMHSVKLSCIFDCSLKNMSDVGNYEKYNVFIRKKDKVSSTLSGRGGGTKSS